MTDGTRSAASIRRDEAQRLAALSIHPDKIRVVRGEPICYVSQSMLLHIIALELSWKEIGGMFLSSSLTLVPDSNIRIPVWSAVDNRDGCCWVEDFYHESAAVRWLNDEYQDTSDLQKRDVYRLEREIDSYAALNDPDRKALIRWLDRIMKLYGIYE